MKALPILITTGLLCLADAGFGQSLDDLLRRQNYTAGRVSSADPSGGNLDMRKVVAGQTLTLAELNGPGVITHIWFTHLYPSRSSLRKLVFRIYFDDLQQPCVEAPLGDFFGLGHAQTYAYASQPLAAGTHGGLNCYWPMPFSTKARLTVSNEGAQDCSALYFQIDYRKVDKEVTEGLHFFASYRQEFPATKEQRYTLLDTDGGEGHFVGCNLSIEQQDESWWGEGDIRMFVDGEKQPSIAGTGSEDDFGGAWCYSHVFSFPQFGAPLRARFNTNGILEHCTSDLRGKDLAQWRWPAAWQPGDLWNVYRYHISDPVPFRRSILVNIEHGWINNERADWLSSVAYWYQTGQPSRRATLPAVQERIPGYLRPRAHNDGRWEGENLVDVAKPTGGSVHEAGMEFWGDMFSHQFALQWDAAGSGNSLAVPFTVTNAGHYRIVARLSRVSEGGTFNFAIDESQPGKAVNLYAPPPFPGMFEHLVSESELKAGKHMLNVRCIAADAKSKGNRLLLDYLRVAPIEASQKDR